jgi:hypothetical protein
LSSSFYATLQKYNSSRYNWNIVKVVIKHPSINHQKDFIIFFILDILPYLLRMYKKNLAQLYVSQLLLYTNRCKIWCAFYYNLLSWVFVSLYNMLSRVFAKQSMNGFYISGIQLVVLGRDSSWAFLNCDVKQKLKITNGNVKQTLIIRKCNVKQELIIANCNVKRKLMNLL